ncbi:MULTISPECIES: LysR family transcriptional regulator [Bacillus]|uniref:LysR family transcriptional regulator n=1 Tax=Bacillus TaxID=1386 RepID=UPI0002DD172B|nr:MULTISPECIES: LysR family transcriptional regulator [Bacillus]
MNIEQLIYICEVSKTGSFTKAAESCHITLSAISQAVSNLEAEFGITLFKRARGSGAVPTTEGKVFTAKAAEIITKINELKKEAESFKETISGELKIATIPGPMHLLIHSIAAFKKDYPQIKIEILEKGPREIIEDLQQNRIDIGLMILHEAFEKNMKGFSVEKLIKGKMVVGVHKHSSLSLLNKIDPEILQKQTIVLYDDEYIHWFMNQLITHYGPHDILFTSNNTQAIQNAIRDELAVTVGLDYSFKSNNSYMVALPLNLPEMKPVHYGWVYREDHHKPALVKKFLSRLKDGL